MVPPIVFKKGQLIVRTKPIVYSLSHKYVGIYCSGCFFPKYGISSLSFPKAHLKKCATCGQFEYCSDQCQESDWEAFHKVECPIYVKHGHEEPFKSDLIRASLRCLTLMQHKCKQMIKVLNIRPFGKTCFMDSSDNEDSMRLIFRSYMPPFEDAIAYFTEIGLQFNAPMLREVLFKLIAKQVDICDFVTLRTIGIGVYLGPSLFKHSCSPSAAMVFEGLNMQIRAVKDVHKKDTITLAHCNITLPKVVRHFELCKKFLPLCMCARCTDKCDLDDQLCKQLHPLYHLFREKMGLADKGLFCVEKALEIFADMIKLNERILGQSHPILTFHKFFYFYFKVTRRKKHQAKSGSLLAELKVTHGTGHSLIEYVDELSKKEFKLRPENEAMYAMMELGLNPIDAATSEPSSS